MLHTLSRWFAKKNLPVRARRRPTARLQVEQLEDRLAPSTFTSLLTFGDTSAPLGYNPGTALIADANGDLFGTTQFGGTGGGNGTVFELLKISGGYNFINLANFTGTTGAEPGANPNSLVADANGDLFGTTAAGGSGGNGTVFELQNASGFFTFISLANFTGTSGAVLGNTPNSLIADAKGNLFGTTQYGGTGGSGSGDGTVFELQNTTGTFTFISLVSFTGTSGGQPGAGPVVPLIADAGGDLFGTTPAGGTGGAGGTVFELKNTSGTFTFVPLVNFTGTSGVEPGSDPLAPLVADAGGDLFGTTQFGGTGGLGTVFELQNNTGTFTFIPLVNFTGTTGAELGSAPNAALIADANGDLFGNTASGGIGAGFGTVFELQNTGGSFTFLTLANFTGTSGAELGANPLFPLIADAGGDLFGTTFYGGTAGTGGGFGTVFELQNTSGGYSFRTLVDFLGILPTLGNAPTYLIAEAGNLIGTTFLTFAGGPGTVYEISQAFISLTPPLLPTATAGNYFSQSITASNGAGPYTYAVVGALPAGLAININSGLLSGLPTVSSGSPYRFTIQATDSLGNTGLQAYSLTVDPAIVLSPGTLLAGTINTSYSRTISASGGAGGSYSYMASGALDGLSINAGSGLLAGTLSGTSGTYNFTVTAVDSIGATGSINYSLTVYGVANSVALFSGTNQSGTVGAPLANPLVVEVLDSSGNPVPGVTVNWAVTSGGGSPSIGSSSTTNTAGLASITATLGATTGTNTFSATVGLLTPVTFTETAKAAPVATSITVTAGTPQSTAVNTAFVTNLAATVTDQYGNPMAGVTVVFAAPSFGPSGVFGGSTSVLTGSNGVAIAPIFAANIFAGSYTVTASTSGVSSPANFTLTNNSPLGNTANDIYVENVYGYLLNRVADLSAVFWVHTLGTPVMPATPATPAMPVIVIQGIEGSTEYIQDQVNGLYLHYLGRPADSGGLNYWTSVLAGGGTFEQVADGLVGSAEYFTLHGSNNTQFVVALYQDVLNRTVLATDPGVQYWLTVLAGGAMRAQVGMDFLISQEYRTNLIDSYYAQFLNRAADSGGQSYWLSQLAQGVSDQTVLAAIFGSAEGYAKWS